MQRMIFQRGKNGGRIVLGEASLGLIQRYIQTKSDMNEAGGMLLGRLIINSEDVIVDEATEPTKKDKQFRFFFWRSKVDAQVKVNEAWRNSDKTRVYLGEWHTHPEDVPSPSCIDLKNWRRIVRKSTFEYDSLFFLIAGRVEIRIWELHRGERAPVLLQQCNDLLQ